MIVGLWIFGILCCVVGSAMMAYAYKILSDAYGKKPIPRVDAPAPSEPAA